jgi:putative oxidoreductase
MRSTVSMRSTSSLLVPGRMLLALIFVIAGIEKIANFGGTEGYMASKGMPLVPLFLVLAILVEVLGGALVFLGLFARTSAVVLFLYLIPVTLIFHGFWRFHGVEAQMQLVNFLKNLAIMGGLLTLAATTAPTPVSIDAARAHRHEPRHPSPSAA